MQAEVICDRRGYYVDREGRSYYSGKYWINSCIRWAQQEATMYEEQAKELKKNTEVVRASFNCFNLNALQVAYCPYGTEDEENDADCDLLVEVSALNNEPMTCSAYIKINLYDNNGDLMCNENHYVQADAFTGYDTFRIMLINDSKTLLIAKYAKVYMSRSL